MITRREMALGATALVAASALGVVTVRWKGAAMASKGTFEITRTSEEWRKLLNPDQYAVLREEATERPFTSPHNNEKRKGNFACAGCDLPLFSSDTKFEVWHRLAELLGADRKRGRHRQGYLLRHGPRGGALPPLRWPSRPRVRGRPEAHGAALLHQRARTEIRARRGLSRWRREQPEDQDQRQHEHGEHKPALLAGGPVPGPAALKGMQHHRKCAPRTAPGQLEAGLRSVRRGPLHEGERRCRDHGSRAKIVDGSEPRPARKQISERPRCGEGESQYDGIACTPSTRVACGARGGYKGTSLGQSEHGRERRVSAENGGLGQVGRQPCRIILIGRWNLGATARFLGFGGVSSACPLSRTG